MLLRECISHSMSKVEAGPTDGAGTGIDGLNKILENVATSMTNQ